MDGGAWWTIVHGVVESDTSERLHFDPRAAPGWGPSQGSADPWWSLCLVQLLGLGPFSPSIVLPRLAAIRTPASALMPLPWPPLCMALSQPRGELDPSFQAPAGPGQRVLRACCVLQAH